MLALSNRYYDIFKRIFQTAEIYGITCVIAGGAAVQPESASDIDVFVIGDAVPTDKLAIALGGGLRRGCELPDSIDQADRAYLEDERGRFFRSGTVTPTWCPLPIHVIGWAGNSDGKTVHALLKTFDLSVHAWAYDASMTLHRIPESTFPEEPIRVMRVTPTTQERLLKLSQRYHPHEFVADVLSSPEVRA